MGGGDSSVVAKPADASSSSEWNFTPDAELQKALTLAHNAPSSERWDAFYHAGSLDDLMGSLAWALGKPVIPEMGRPVQLDAKFDPLPNSSKPAVARRDIEPRVQLAAIGAPIDLRVAQEALGNVRGTLNSLIPYFSSIQRGDIAEMKDVLISLIRSIDIVFQRPSAVTRELIDEAKSLYVALLWNNSIQDLYKERMGSGEIPYILRDLLRHRDWTKLLAFSTKLAPVAQQAKASVVQQVAPGFIAAKDASLGSIASLRDSALATWRGIPKVGQVAIVATAVAAVVGGVAWFVTRDKK